MVVIHPLADDRQSLAIEKTGEVIEVNDAFYLTISYNPSYKGVLKFFDIY